ncbi:TPA: hypothetical protein ACNH9H_002842 [Pseudomonas aeruginosa]|nr:hypothetical protein [Pseudomonas aeruginosa]HEJ2068547.1 hypothetical protein [Pseudomonas aeruginosa]HEJ4469369.1 hypothetical protein [Pseudomonas aeruginosa]HEJ5099306.1 hypothetical protein [Pseudomonas aeruginosa]HEJ5111256.1 hypothetical protein [Pseudomonas aeruginosa]
MIDPVEFGKAMGAIVREATAPLIARIEQLEKALSAQTIPSADEVAARIDLGALAKSAAEMVPPPKDADMEALKEHLSELVKAIPAPADGQSVTVEDVAPLIREEVAKAVAEVPPAKDGESVTVDEVRPILADLVGKAVADLPPPAPGKDADMEALRAHLGDLVKGIQLPTVPTIDEVAATFERRFSDLTLSWERQARETFDKAADRMPIPKDGRDALPLECFDLALGEDGRTVTVKMQAGDVVVEKSVKIASVIDRGVFSAEKSYEQGDGTTYGGCYWIAQKDAPAGVPGGSDDWRLAVKKGRDGKDLRDSASKHDPSKGVKIRKDEDDDK